MAENELNKNVEGAVQGYRTDHPAEEKSPMACKPPKWSGTQHQSVTNRIVLLINQLMMSKTQSYAAVVALTTAFSATLAGSGEVQAEDQRISLQSRESIDEESISSSAAVKRDNASNVESTAKNQLSRDLIDTDTGSNNYAPGCGQSTGTYHSKYLGCYDDRQDDRAFPFQVPSNGHGTVDCERECTSRRYRYFGRQFKGQCFCGSDYSQIVRHGTETGCNCCAVNVGGGKQCVWENMKHPESQQAEAPIPMPVTAPAEAPNSQLFANSAHVGSLSFGSTNLFEEPKEEPEMQNAAQVQNTPSGSSTKPTRPFRLRLYWQRGYNWQNSSSEKWWCAECTGNCSNGSRLQIRRCSQTSRQKWVAVDKTIRFAPNRSLCLTASGVGAKNPVRLRTCNGGRGQKFDGVREQGRFELQPSSNPGRCISQHHHPKDKEPLYPETCSKTRSTKTTYWQVY